MPLLKYNLDQSILEITLSDPSSQNAFSPEMAEAFNDVLDSQSFNGLVLSAEGRTFCSGGNLQFYKSLKSRDEGLAYNRRITEILDRLSALPIAKSCYVNGPCYGGGLELLSCFDYVVAHPSALFGLWQRRVGLTYGWGGRKRLEERLTSQRLRSWLSEASTLSSLQAKGIGLVDAIDLQKIGMDKVKAWVGRTLDLGHEELAQVMLEPDQSFADLWLGPKHKSVLSRFR